MIYLTQWSHRLTYEEIEDLFPELIPGLVNNEYIGFLVVRSSEKGDLAIGKNGIYYLDTGEIDGENPLLGFVLLRSLSEVMEVLEEANQDHSYCILQIGKLVMMKLSVQKAFTEY